MPDGTFVRLATRDDIGGVRAIARAYGNLGYWPRRPDYLDHELESGRLLVAVDGGVGGTLAIAAVLERGGVAHLAELFVRLDRLGQGIGGRLLTEVLAGTEERVTFARSDPRALPLYARHGMRPVTPLLYLRGDRRAAGRLPAGGVSVEAVDSEDVVGLDARASERGRPEDLAFLSGAGTGALLCRRGGEAVGYGFCRPLGPDGAGKGKRAILGPLGARDEREARSTVLAVARAAAAGGAEAVYVALLGPHPALAELLKAGFRVGDADTFMASGPGLLDGRLYAPSSDLG